MGEFVKVLIEAVLIVLAVSFISLGLHTKPLRIDIWPGLVVGITIPLVLAITFVTMFYWGVGLHKISLGSLIIALGLLVDDAIIAVEMMVRKLEEGYDRARAATFTYELVAMPMLTGTLITAAGFLPIGLAKSVTGEYTFAIFAVTAAALVISWVVSVYFVPYLGWWLLHTRKQVDGEAHEDELFGGPFYTTIPPHRGLVRAAPLDHHRPDRAELRAGHGRHGPRAAAVLPRFEPARDPGRPVAARGLDDPAERRGRARASRRG